MILSRCCFEFFQSASWPVFFCLFVCLFGLGNSYTDQYSGQFQTPLSHSHDLALILHSGKIVGAAKVLICRHDRTEHLPQGCIWTWSWIVTLMYYFKKTKITTQNKTNKNQRKSLKNEDNFNNFITLLSYWVSVRGWVGNAFVTKSSHYNCSIISHDTMGIKIQLTRSIKTVFA